MDLLDRLLEHDRWTTHRILSICRTLTPEQMQQDFAIGPGTLDATLRHMILNVQVWTDLMYSRPVQPGDAVRGAALTDLASVYTAVYADFTTCARRMSDDDRLDDVFLDVLDVPPRPKTFGGAIAHVITHNMHHRAELLNMLGKLGVEDLPEGDVLSWEAQRSG